MRPLHGACVLSFDGEKMTVEYTTRIIIRPNGTCFAEPPKGVTLSHREALYKQCAEKCNGYMTIKMSTPHRKRTTGAKSQNHHFNGHCQLISRLTGQPIDDVRRYIKARAVSRGYPMLMDIYNEPMLDLWGNVQGMSEADASVEQCKMLIDEVHQFAAEEGIALEEGADE